MWAPSHTLHLQVGSCLLHLGPSPELNSFHSQNITLPCYFPSADEWIRKLWYIYTMECYSAIKNNSFESVLMRWMKLEPIIQSEVSQKDKDQYSILTHIYGILKHGNDNPICKTEKETWMYRTDVGTLWEKVRVGCSERIALKQVYYQR